MDCFEGISDALVLVEVLVDIRGAGNFGLLANTCQCLPKMAGKRAVSETLAEVGGQGITICYLHP